MSRLAVAVPPYTEFGGLWVTINPQNMCTVCYGLHLCMYSALKVYIHPWELNL